MISRALDALDERLGTARFVTSALRKAFPDHWSFLLGEVNVYAFALLIATGTFLSFFYHPSASKTVYDGPYTLLAGRHVSQAYESALRISFAVNGGLLIRQIHHWTALVFIAGILTHMGRIFFTGAFRKPRELNWVAGILLFICALGDGFTGYSLPDDVLSGTGLRIADSVLLSIPLVGTWASFLLIGGAYPTQEIIPRLFVAHILIIPVVIATLIGLHLAMVWRQKHTQFPGPGKTEHNVVGSPLFPNYAARSFALFFALLVVVSLLGAFVQINPIWLWGPYEPWTVASPAQPDWYVGWLDGLLRIGPAFAIHLFGHTIPSPFWVAVLVPLCMFTCIAAYPWIEALVTADHRMHNLLNIPREVPLRTSLGAAVLAFVAVLTLAGSGDVQARYAHWSITVITHFYQALCIIAPPIAFAVTYAFCVDLRARGGVRKSPRVRLTRNASGGYDAEEIA